MQTGEQPKQHRTSQKLCCSAPAQPHQIRSHRLRHFFTVITWRSSQQMVLKEIQLQITLAVLLFSAFQRSFLYFMCNYSVAEPEAFRNWIVFFLVTVG